MQHSRARNYVAEATALGARVSQARLFFNRRAAAKYLVPDGRGGRRPQKMADIVANCIFLRTSSSSWAVFFGFFTFFV